MELDRLAEKSGKLAKGFSVISRLSSSGALSIFYQVGSNPGLGVIKMTVLQELTAVSFVDCDKGRSPPFLSTIDMSGKSRNRRNP